MKFSAVPNSGDFVFSASTKWPRASCGSPASGTSALPRYRQKLPIVGVPDQRHDGQVGRQAVSLHGQPDAVLAFAVGVFGGEEAALGMGHVPQDVTEDAAGDVGVAGLRR